MGFPSYGETTPFGRIPLKNPARYVTWMSPRIWNNKKTRHGIENDMKENISFIGDIVMTSKS